MATRTITGTVVDGQGEPISGAPVTFAMDRGTYLLDPDMHYAASMVSTRTDSDGEFSVEIEAGLPVVWNVSVAGQTYIISVPTGDDTTLEALRAEYSGGPPAINRGNLPYMPVFNVMSPLYGAEGDGTTNDRGAFQEAIDAAEDAGGGIVSAPSGLTFKLNSGLTLASNVTLELGAGTTLDFSGAPTSEVLITAAGTEGSTTLLTGDVALGATSVDVTSASGLAVGDLVRIGSTTQFDSFNTDIPIGEINRINAISSLTITLEMPTQFAYTTAASAVLSKITPVTGVRVRGGRILGGGEGDDHRALYINKAENVIVEGVEFDRTSVTGVELADCVHARIVNNYFHKFHDNATAYGVSVASACSDIIVAHNHFLDVRHALTVSGSASVKGIPRRITFAHNTVTASAGSGALGSGSGDAIDTHGGADEVFILDNIIHAASGNAINIEGRNMVVRGNVITFPGTSSGIGISIKNYSDYDAEIEVSHNTVRSSSSHAIRISNSTQGATSLYRAVQVHSNLIVSPVGVGIYLDSSTTDRNARYSVVGNTVYASASTLAPIYLELVTGGVVTGNMVSSTVTSASGIRLDDCLNITVSANEIELASSATGQGIYFNGTSAGATANCIADANRVVSPSASNSKGITLDNDAIDCVIGPANDFRSCTTEISRGTGTGHRVYPISGGTIQNTTIASDAITVNTDTTLVFVDTEGAAATDNLSTISGGAQGQRLIVVAANATRDVVIKDSVGNILSVGDFTMDTTGDTWECVYDGTNWLEVGRSNN